MNGKDGDPDEKRPFTFQPEKVRASWAKIGAMPLTRSALKHKKVRSVTGGSGPGAGRLEGLQVEHDANCDQLVVQRLVSSALPRAHPSTEEAQDAALVVERKITPSSMPRTVGAVPFNSQVVFKAQAEQHAAYAPPRKKKEQCARDKAKAIAASVSARAKRGAAGDD